MRGANRADSRMLLDRVGKEGEPWLDFSYAYLGVQAADVAFAKLGRARLLTQNWYLNFVLALDARAYEAHPAFRACLKAIGAWYERRAATIVIGAGFAGLPSVPKALHLLTPFVTSLHLVSLDIDALPRAVSRCVHLHTLQIRACPVTDMCDLSRMRELRTLVVSATLLERVEFDTIHLHLARLDLSGNRMRYLCWTKLNIALPALQLLNVADNPLLCMGSEGAVVATRFKLQSLTVSHTSVAVLPPDILRDVKMLRCSNCPKLVLPTMTNDPFLALRSADLAHNGLTAIPEAILGARGLSHLNLRLNPIAPLHVEKFAALHPECDILHP